MNKRKFKNTDTYTEVKTAEQTGTEEDTEYLSDSYDEEDSNDYYYPEDEDEQELKHSVFHYVYKLLFPIFLLTAVLLTLFWVTYCFASTKVGTELLSTVHAYYDSMDNGRLVMRTTMESLEVLKDCSQGDGYVTVTKSNGDTVKVANKNVYLTDCSELFEVGTGLHLFKRTIHYDNLTTKEDYCLYIYNSELPN